MGVGVGARQGQGSWPDRAPRILLFTNLRECCGGWEPIAHGCGFLLRDVPRDEVRPSVAWRPTGKRV